jgi:endothelin-converting enzyme/putative endopeptidase
VTATQAQDAKPAKEPGINIQYLISSKPSDDFFRYVNGTWLNTTEILVTEPVGVLMN